MRVGDAYKIKSLSENGASDEDIIKAYRNDYSEEEVRKFIPAQPKKRGPKPKVDPLG